MLTDSIDENARYRLSPAQLGIWFDILMNKSRAANYNIGGYHDINGVFFPEIYEEAFNLLVDQLPVLRTRLDCQGLVPKQYVADREPVEIPVLDFSNKLKPEIAAREWMTAQLARSLDVAGKSLYSIAILKLSDSHNYRYFSCHHILMDGVGIGLVNEYAAAAYNSLISGGIPSTLECASCQDYAEAQYEIAASEEYAKSKEYWTSLWKDYISSPHWNKRVSRSEEQLDAKAPGTNVRCLEYTIAPRLYARLKAFSETNHLGMSQVLVAIGAVCWSRITGAPVISAGLTHHGRASDAGSQLIGMCTNILPLVVDTNVSEGIAERILSIANQLKMALAHNKYRFEDFMKEIYPRDSGMIPFDLTINVLRWRSPIYYGNVKSYSHVLSIGPINDVGLLFVDRVEGDSLRIELRTNFRKYSEAEGRKVLDELLTTMQSIR